MTTAGVLLPFLEWKSSSTLAFIQGCFGFALSSCQLGNDRLGSLSAAWTPTLEHTTQPSRYLWYLLLVQNYMPHLTCHALQRKWRIILLVLPEAHIIDLSMLSLRLHTYIPRIHGRLGASQLLADIVLHGVQWSWQFGIITPNMRTVNAKMTRPR